MLSTMRPVVRTSQPAYTVPCNLEARARDPLWKESRGSRKNPQKNVQNSLHFIIVGSSTQGKCIAAAYFKFLAVTLKNGHLFYIPLTRCVGRRLLNLVLCL